MPQSVLLKAAGLYTFPNNLSEIPPGSLTVADNVVIDKNGIIESRRGLHQYGNTFGIGTDRAKQLLQYKNRLLRHFATSLQYDNGSGTFTSFSGTFAETEDGLRIKSIEANGNLYFTTAAGIYRISAATAAEFTAAANYIRLAGGVQALDVNGVVDYTSGGWFIYQTDVPGQTKVAYRVTWAFYDANKNLVEGAPSSRLVLTNYSTTDSANVNLTFQVPSDISTTDTQFFYRVYRTAVVQTSVGVTLANLDPGDEQYLVIEDYPTSAQLTSRTVNVTDITPEAFRKNGALLYTNPVSGEGILQSNYAPPIAKDINLFQNTVFYANTQTIQQLNLSLLSTLNLVSGTSYVFILNGSVLSALSTPSLVTGNTINISNFYVSGDEIQYTTSGTVITGLTNEDVYYIINPTPTSFQLSTTPGGSAVILTSDGVGTQSFSSGQKYTFVGTAEQQQFTFDTKANTADGSYFLINAASDVRKYFVWFSKNGAPEVTNFTFDTVANTTDGGYFLVNSANDVSQYFVWFDKTGSTSAPSGGDTINKIGIRVPLVGLTTSSQVATAVANALPISDFGSAVNTNIVTVTNTAYGATTNATSGVTPPGGAFAITILQQGVNATTQPAASDTAGRLPVLVDISQAITASDVAFAVASALNEITDFSAVQASANVTVTNTDNGYVNSATSFTVAAANASAGAVYSNNGQEFIVLQTIVAGTTLVTSYNGAPLSSGTLSKVSGSGDATITFSAFTTLGSHAGLTSPGGAFAISYLQNGTGEDTSLQYVLLGNNISPSISIDETARSLVKNINSNPDESVNAYYISGPTDLPGQILLQARSLSQGAFAIVADSIATGAEFNPALPTSGTSVTSTNLVEPNAIYYSKFQQPEAVPIVNKFLVGPKDKAIIRILPIRTGLMILKEDGIYRLTGTNGQFTIDPFDNSAIILAADSAQVLNNQIYMFSTQGIVTLTDTGVSVISRPIEDKLERIITPGFDYRPNTFGVAYESDRAYLLWTVTNNNDTQPTQCFRFNTFTTAWTRWPISKTCGIVKFDTNVLYVGPGDENFIEEERKSIDRTDYADRDFDIEIPISAVVSSDVVSLSSTSDVVDGDVLVQTQYLTIYQFNQLLLMLDSDPQLGYHNYYSTLATSPGANLRDSLDNLANKLDTDSGLNETDFYSSMTHGVDFVDFQTDYNILTTLINANVNPLFHNYPTSTGTVVFDMIIIQPIQNTNDVQVLYLVPIIQGPIVLSQGITTEVVWAPQTFGDPSISKHVSEGTFIFNDTVFTNAVVSYASDLMPNFEEVEFDESGIGDWGGFVWNEQYWGGTGSSVPLRTYIPRNKQYCRFLRPRFTHNTSREKFELLGASLTFRPLTERAYRS